MLYITYKFDDIIDVCLVLDKLNLLSSFSSPASAATCRCATKRRSASSERTLPVRFPCIAEQKLEGELGGAGKRGERLEAGRSAQPSPPRAG